MEVRQARPKLDDIPFDVGPPHSPGGKPRETPGRQRLGTVGVSRQPSGFPSPTVEGETEMKAAFRAIGIAIPLILAAPASADTRCEDLHITEHMFQDCGGSDDFVRFLACTFAWIDPTTGDAQYNMILDQPSSRDLELGGDFEHRLVCRLERKLNSTTIQAA